MPFADPRKSFDAAVRHLFRHINDVGALRKNPLVSARFAPSYRSPIKNEVILAAIRSDILDAARECHAEDIEAGLASQGERSFAIIAGICSGRTAWETANELGLSRPQYYRDRRSVCMRVSRWLQKRNYKAAAQAFIFDPFQFDLRRVAGLYDQGMSAKAIAESERLLHGASSPTATISILLRLAEAALNFGDVARASKTLSAARLLLKEPGPNEDLPEQRLLGRFLEFRLALPTNSYDSTDRMIEALVGDCRGMQTRTPERDDIEIRILFEYCLFVASRGRFNDARMALERATALERRNRHMAPEHRVRIALMKAFAYEDGSVSLDELSLRLGEALDLARCVGSTTGVIAASVRLSHYCAALDDDEQAQAYADRALFLARACEGNQALFFTVISLAPGMMHTRYWKTLGAPLSDLERAPLGGSQDCQLKAAQGAFLLRQGKYTEAIRTLSAVESSAQYLGMRRTRMRALRNCAVALHRAGQRDGAKDRMQKAVDLAQSGGDLTELGRTYSTAYEVLGESRLLVLANENAARLTRVSKRARNSSTTLSQA